MLQKDRSLTPIYLHLFLRHSKSAVKSTENRLSDLTADLSMASKRKPGQEMRGQCNDCTKLNIFIAEKMILSLANGNSGILH